MKSFLQAAVTIGVVVAMAGAARAGEVKLQIRDGRVTLEARDVTVRDILAEWAHVGQTRILNGEKVGGGLVTLTLKDVPEREALDILLRSVGGYMAAPREEVIATASIYDRIMVMATVRTTPPPASGANQGAAQQGFRVGVGGRGGQAMTPRPGSPADDPTADDQPITPGLMRPGPLMDQLQFQQNMMGTPGSNQGVMIQTTPGGAIQLTPTGAVNPALDLMRTLTPGATPAGSAAPGLPTGTTTPGAVAPGSPGATTAKPIRPPGGGLLP